MQLKYSIFLLVILFSIGLAVANKRSPTFEDLVENTQRRIVKRDIFDDIRNAFKGLGDTFSGVIDQIKNFSVENYEKFKKSLASLGKDEQEKTLDKLRTYYDGLSDKSTAEAQRMKGTIDELVKDIGTGGCTSVRGSLMAATVLSLLSMVYLY